MAQSIHKTVLFAVVLVAVSAVLPIAAFGVVTPSPRRTTALAVFGRSGGGGKKSSSPLLGEALEAYPFRFDGPRAMVSEAKAAVAFNELARLYGDEEALAMVKIFPRALVFDSSNYGPCLEAWTEQFGPEAARKMVGRNPGLLGVKPFTAREPAEASMAFSYIIAATRPLPGILAAGLLLSIATAGLH